MFFLRHNPAFYHGYFEPSTVLMSRPQTFPATTEEAGAQDNKTVYRSIDAHVNESDDSFALVMDLPGVKSDKLTVQVDGGTLTIAADRPTSNGSIVAYRQRFALDEDTVDADNLKASLSDGVLSVQVPKKEEAKPFDVPVIEGEASTSTAEDLRLTFDVPGVKASDIKAAVHNGVLSVKGERKKGNTYSRVQRSMTLDRHRTDLMQLKAYLANGVLTFTAPQKEQAPAKQIKLDGEDKPKQNIIVESVPEGELAGAQ